MEIWKMRSGKAKRQIDKEGFYLRDDFVVDIKGLLHYPE